MLNSWRRFHGRRSRRDILLANKRALDFMAAASDQPPLDIDIAPAPQARKIRRPVDGQPAAPLEKRIVADILQALRHDPRVAFVWRHTSGTFQDGERWIQTGPKGMPDICGFLAGSGRFVGIEIKRPGQKPDERQVQCLEHFKQNGAIAGIATSVKEALALLS